MSRVLELLSEGRLQFHLEPKLVEMENWINNHQVGHWRSSSHNGKVSLDKRYMYMHSNVMNWEDYAVKEAFDDAKFRIWAENNGLPCNIPLPYLNMYIDDVDWDASVDSELSQHNESQRGIPKEYCGGDLHDKYQASNGGNANWGTWEGNNRSTENSMSWSNNHEYQHGNNEYKMNTERINRGRGRGRGRRGGRGRGRRGNYTPNLC
ncbi:hypothetical protein RYX36_030878 [Vicia faba]